MPSRERTETVTEADGPTDAGCRTIRAEESQDVLGDRWRAAQACQWPQGSPPRPRAGSPAESEACRYIDQKAISQKKNGHA